MMAVLFSVKARVISGTTMESAAPSTVCTKVVAASR